MTDIVWIILILALLIALGLLIFFVLRNQDISKLKIKAGNVEADVTTREAGAVTLTGVKQTGEGGKIDISRGSVHLKEIEQDGKRQQISIKPEPK